MTDLDDKRIGITEAGDPVFNLSWQTWIRAGHPAILITKDPLKLYDLLQGLPTDRIIVHCTITTLGGTVVEKNVPPTQRAIEGLDKFYQLLGREKTVLRIDPIFPYYEWTLDAIIDLVNNAKMIDSNFRIRISFVDNYGFARERFIQAGLDMPIGFHYPLSKRKEIWRNLGHPEICGEPGIPGASCISARECTILGAIPAYTNKEQRPACGCLANKYEILIGKNSRKRCHHQCLYCYWRD